MGGMVMIAVKRAQAMAQKYVLPFLQTVALQQLEMVVGMSDAALDPKR